jgi:hypothetical protein
MKIFGQVVDTSNEPMSLANITIITGVKAYKLGAYTDLDGNFVLEDDAVSEDSEFKISYVGYESQFRKTNELQGQKIKLADKVEQLEEVIINIGKKPFKFSSASALVKSNKEKFVRHLEDHKFVYAGLGGLAGIILIARAFKK